VTYAVWAWPPGPVAAEMTIPANLTDARVALAAAVNEVALDGLEPVTFDAELLDPASDDVVAVLWRVTLDPAGTPSDRGWRETTVDLAPWRKRRWRLRLRASGAAAGRHGLADRPPTRSSAALPNIVPLAHTRTLTTSALRYGATRYHAPRRSVVFEHADAPLWSMTASHRRC
jgi:hypothetical protein